MNRSRCLTLVLTVALLLAACASPTPSATATPSAAPAGTPQRGLAVVNTIEVFPPGGPADPARVVAHGQLPDGCSTLASDTVDRQAQTFVVTIATQRQPGAACAAVGQTFQDTVIMDVSSAPAGDYVVVVNGVTGRLTLAASPTAAGSAPATLAAATPAATPAPGVSPTLAASPAAAGSSTAAPRATPAVSPTAAVNSTVAGSPTPAVTLTPPTPAPTVTPTLAVSPTASGSSTATGSSTAAGSSTAGSTTAAACTNIGAFYGDVTIPDDTAFKQGETFTKIWKVRNQGTCTWQSYALIFAGGDNMSAPLSVTLPVVAPATVIQLSQDFVAPTRGGEQVGNWEFADAQGNRFGVGPSGVGPLWVKILVNYSGQENVTTPTAGNSCGAARQPGYESTVLSLLNAQRAAAGLARVALQPQLAAAAAQHAFDMACNDFISHAGSDGSSWGNRVAAQGYTHVNTAREIIYAGDVTFGGDPAGAVDWWMNSPIHHDIVLYPTVTQVGVGVALSPSKANWGYYTVVFAGP